VDHALKRQSAFLPIKTFQILKKDRMLPVTSDLSAKLAQTFKRISGQFKTWDISRKKQVTALWAEKHPMTD
jgi:hypothetical protein